MLCKKPFNKDGLRFGCGQCLPCRINKRRQWTNRLLLEATQYEKNAFVTLTYSEVPLCDSLCKRHVQLFLKRLRKYVYPNQIRYYCAGEYGNPDRGIRTFNPHYHLAIFNYPSCVYGRPASENKACHCTPCRIIQKAWTRGRTYNATLEPDSAGYVAQYITKKMTNKFDPRLEGRTPEFAIMSLRPPIGDGAIKHISQLVQGNSFALDDIDNTGDVVPFLNIGSKKLPLDRTMKRKLRIYLGRDEKISDELLDQLKLDDLEYRQDLLAQCNYDYAKYGQRLRSEQSIRAVEKNFKRKETNGQFKL